MCAKNYRAVKGQAYTRTEFVHARAKPDQTIIAINVNANGVEIAKEALKHGSAKLPILCEIVIEKVQMEEVKALE
jgi:ribosomal protein L16/L10AE